MSDRPVGTPDPALAAAIAAVAHGADADATLDELIRLAGEVTGATMGAAFLWDSEAGALALAGSVGVPDEMKATFDAAVADPDNPVTRSARDRVVVLAAPMAFPQGAGVVAAWPIVIARGGVEEPVGALALSHAAPWAVDPATSDRVAAITELTGIAVDRAQMAELVAQRSEWFERVSHSDALTGLANARTLARVLELELARAGRQGGEVSVAIFDVDGLRAINDESGHAVGDDVLREVAAVVAESVRLVDTVARWGGDEFLLVAPGSAGMTVARRIVDAVAARPPVGGHPLSVSAGVARFPRDAANAEEIVKAAGAALGSAKAKSRGTIAETAAAS